MTMELQFRLRRAACVLTGFVSFLTLARAETPAQAEAPAVRVAGTPGKWRLTRGGESYFIRGAGGDGSWETLARLGGNSVRTWGHERLGEQLDLAQKLGLTVTAGTWLGQVRQGFDWSDADSLIGQRERVREVVARHKDHPALLAWALGNEMEDPAGKNGAVWSEINNLARLVKSLDPRHPTMTVVGRRTISATRRHQTVCAQRVRPARNLGDPQGRHRRVSRMDQHREGRIVSCRLSPGGRRGGFDLTGAKRLVFDARGDVGGEEVSFGFGLIGSDKRYFDTAKRTLDKVKLTRDWQRFEIRLADLKSAENLTRIKTGFVWTVASPGQPVVFYLDNIRWE